MSTQIYKKNFLIFGCGNTLLGNDGFGPEVINYLNHRYTLPDCAIAIDAGTGIRDFIFDLLLLEKKPELLIIIDAVSVKGKSPGEVFEIDLLSVPREKMSDFSLHQSPSSNLLSQLKDAGVDVRILGMNTLNIPNVINPGLDAKTLAALPIASEWILKKIQAQQISSNNMPEVEKCL